MRKGRAVVHGEMMTIDNDLNIGRITTPIHVVKDEMEVTANTFTIFIDEDYALLTNGIVGVRHALQNFGTEMDEREVSLRNSDTILIADSLKYWSKTDNEIKVNIFGNIIITQGSKRLTGKEGHYDKATGEFSIKKAQLTADNLEWLLTADTRAKFTNPDLLAGIAMPVTVNARLMTFNQNDRVLTLTGRVEIHQPDKVIKCNKLVFDDSTQTVRLEGAVQLVKDNQDQLLGNKIVVSLKDEHFRLHDQIEAVFELKSKPPTANND